MKEAVPTWIQTHPGFQLLSMRPKQQMQRFLHDPMHMRVFNGVMATLLVASLYPVLRT